MFLFVAQKDRLLENPIIEGPYSERLYVCKEKDLRKTKEIITEVTRVEPMEKATPEDNMRGQTQSKPTGRDVRPDSKVVV